MTYSAIDFFGDTLGMFLAMILECSQMPLCMAVFALAAVLCMIRLGLYLFGA